MEKVFLRVYNREIEGMIEGGQLDEAVAHCQHILKTFPMHIETYRLLGKSFLEARRYADAADIFQRVLNAVPDDFVAHVGMSIIRDDGGQLDDAIWHMERAFEVQPANSAIQGELRRLYGRRDGTEPSKIRLSRDALANMYSQGELFNQAIAEIRSILADDPNRPDLQVMLMRAYHRTGQKVEAAEIAATLLKKYPYCLDSLRVLVDVLPGTARAENTQVYRHRLLMLDPYSTSASDSVFSTDQVANSAVILERLDYKPGAMPSSPQPDWASSLGIKLTTEKRSEPPPEKIQTPKVAEEPTAYPPERLDVGIASAANVAEEPTANLPEHLDAGIASAAHAAEETVPDWRHPAGWMDSTGEPKDDSGKTGEVTPDELIAKSDAGKTGEVSPDESIAKADIPEWLISMAPTGNIEAESTEPEEPAVALPTGEDGIPEWLKPIAPREGSTDLKIKSQSSGGPTSEGEVNPAAPVEAAGELPVESEGSIGTQPAKDEEIPVWIKASTPVEIAGAAIQEPRESAEPQPTSGEDLPQWLKAMTAAEAIGETLKVPQEPVESRPEMAEDIPDWIKSMAPKEAIGETLKESQEVIESQPAVSEDIPDWLKSVAPADTAAKLNVESEPTPSAEPAEEPEAEPTSAEKTSTGEEALPDWLTDLGSKVTPEAPAAAIKEQPAIREHPVPEQAVQEKPGHPDSGRNTGN